MCRSNRNSRSDAGFSLAQSNANLRKKSPKAIRLWALEVRRSSSKCFISIWHQIKRTTRHHILASRGRLRHSLSLEVTREISYCPVPVRLTFLGLPVTLSVIVSVLLWVPVVVGLNVTLMVQLAPPAIGLTHVLV